MSFTEEEKELSKKRAAKGEEVENRRKNQKIFCYYCKRETKQKDIFNEVEISDPKEIVFFDKDGNRKGNAWEIQGLVWRISQCLGCEKINLNAYTRHSPWEDDVPIHHFPIKDFRTFPKWIAFLGKDLTELLCEIYISLNYGNKLLPIMGARTLLDMFIVEKIGDVGTFKSKLQKLVDEKYISESQQKLLQIALEYGNATIHKGYKPNTEEINGVLDIIENLLQTEALGRQSQAIEKAIPKKGK